MLYTRVVLLSPPQQTRQTELPPEEERETRHSTQAGRALSSRSTMGRQTAGQKARDASAGKRKWWGQRGDTKDHEES